PNDKLFLMQQVYATLFSLANKLQVKGDEYLEGLTSRQMMTMIAIIHLPEDGASLNNIARKLGTSKQNVKQLVANMENKGFLAMMPSEYDGRSYNITITESGKQALLENGERGNRLFDDVFRDFTLEELHTLWSLLKKLYRFDGEEQDGFEEAVEFKG
ncbi:MAG TPA: MarR family transcriptional regulator, partial [Methanocella sp.]|uniref:MarR family winged helix-turn-helix transcriptional regulator n=1 Tax=Methanocella sp. TaxID=2052833 RepID=UPI002C214D13